MRENQANDAIRAAVAADGREIARLLTQLGHPTSTADLQARWARWLADGNDCLVAPTDGAALAGIITLHRMLVLHRPHPVGRITALVVDGHRRGQGVGRALVAHAEAVLRQSGCGLVEVTSNIRLKQAHEFYRRIGYERTSERFSKIFE